MPSGISSNSLTLQQYAQESNSPLIQRVVFSLLDPYSILNDVSFETVSSLSARGARIVGSLPAVNYRKLNGQSAVTSGTVSQFSEQAYVLSNIIDIDRLLSMDKNAVGDPAGLQVNMLLKAITYDVTDKFFNNNHASGNADATIGIRQRLDDTTTWGTISSCKIDGGGVDLSDSGLSQANANKFIRFIDQMLDEMGEPEGDGVVLYMNRNLRRRTAQCIRLLGTGAGFDVTRDAFDRRLTTYRNAVIRSVGVKADQSTEIITSTETSAGANGSSNFTSMYGVKYGGESFNGWQMEPLKVQPLGQRLDEPTQTRTFVEWAFGWYQTYTRAISRVYDIKVA
jgi:hypothetical protein